MANNRNQKKAKKRLILGATVIAAAVAVGLSIWHFFFRSDEIKIVWKPLADITSDSKLPKKEYGNLDLSETILNIPDAEKFYQLYIPHDWIFTPEECDAACYEIFDIVFDDVRKANPETAFTDYEGNQLENGKAIREYSQGKHGNSAIRFATENGDEYLCRFNPNGSFIAYDAQAVQIAAVSAGGSGIIEEMIHLDRGEQLPDKKYPVGGEEYSPAQALEFAEKMLSEKLSKYLAGAEMVPAEFMIIKDPASGNYFYRVQFAFIYEKTPYQHLDMASRSIEGTDMEWGVTYVTIGEPDKAAEIYHMMDYPKAENDGEYKDRYVSLESAIALANRYLAPYFEQKISEITINYSFDRDSGDRHLRPYWCLIVDIDDPLAWGYSVSAGTIFVDMQTGEVIAKISEN